MSTYTDKVGYTVRFGGPERIQWIPTGGEAASGNPLLRSFNPAMAANPVGLIIEATKAAALVLQWRELHQQTLLQAAQFEERRIPWLVDMLIQWSSEAEMGQVRLDTSIYFDREVTRLMEKIVDSKLMDVPSSLLLQVERSARGMTAVNQLLYDQLREHAPKARGRKVKGAKLIEYKPFWSLEGDNTKIETYLERIDRNLGILGNAALGYAFGIVGVAAWRFAVWNSARIAAAKKNRLEEFQSLTSLALELRSLRAQLSYAATLPAIETFLALPDAPPNRIEGGGGKLVESAPIREGSKTR
ncbi:MAG: hypothetical protein KDN05_04090 [Verrucomicrobiae bacterium]|nr:hypothetical protein [Verrucomicrobiae bacterium]